MNGSPSRRDKAANSPRFTSALKSFRLMPNSSNGQRMSPSKEYTGFLDGPPERRELYEKLKPGNDASDRMKAALGLSKVVQDYSLSGVTQIWVAGQDLLDSKYPLDVQKAAYQLMTGCVSSQNQLGSMDRVIYFHALSESTNPDCMEPQLRALSTLTRDGRDLSPFENLIASLLSKWVQRCFRNAELARKERDHLQQHGKLSMSHSERDLSNVLDFLTRVLKFNFPMFENRDLNLIVEEIVAICRTTTSSKDIEDCLTCLDVITRYGYVPVAVTAPVLEILCGAFVSVPEHSLFSWTVAKNLLRSHVAYKALSTLKNFLKPSKIGYQINIVRGAVRFLANILVDSDDEDLPEISPLSVMNSLKQCIGIRNVKLSADVVIALNILFESEITVRSLDLVAWEGVLDVLRILLGTSSTKHDGPHAPASKHTVEHISESDRRILIGKLEEIFNKGLVSNNIDIEKVLIQFFMLYHEELKETTVLTILHHYQSEHLCFPSCDLWKENCESLVKCFLRSNKTFSPTVRFEALQIITDAYQLIKGVLDPKTSLQLLLLILYDLRLEKVSLICEMVIEVAVDFICCFSLELGDQVFMSLSACCIPVNAVEEPTNISSPMLTAKDAKSTNFSLSSMVSATAASGCSAIFIRSITSKNVELSSRAFAELLKIASCATAYDMARINALRVLLRIRVNNQDEIFVTEYLGNDSLAALFHRTPETLTPPRLHSNVNLKELEIDSVGKDVKPPSVLKGKTLHTDFSNADLPGAPLWLLPDHLSLPVKPSKRPASHLHAANGQFGGSTLPIAMWIDTIISIFETESSWEVYCYVIVGLPRQLSNSQLFTACHGQLRRIRHVVCDQLFKSGPPKLHPPSELKKADFAIGLIRILTILISYHHIFIKSEEDEIVLALQMGLHKWQRTAKPSIHALTICCYELPLSTSKFLTGILTKLSQIITLPSVSVHILELILTLSSIPALYVNFTENDFRCVFGIAFQYIQHSRSSGISPNQSERGIPSIDEVAVSTSPTSESASYLLSLAYETVTHWFLALRLSERRKYVTYISRGLLLFDKNTSALGEPSQVCWDMITRFTYSEAEAQSRPVAPPIAESVSTSKTWVQGNTIYTITTATATGVSQCTIRRPSGTSYFSLKPQHTENASVFLESEVENAEMPLKDTSDRVMYLPSYMLMQIGLFNEAKTSIPTQVPNDEATIRALAVFDRVPVVDFHKIGVVYIGPAQSDEAKILLNLVGSLAYNEFIDGLGNLVRLKGNSKVYTGGLDTENDVDGEYARLWSDKITQVIFHICSMMPNQQGDAIGTFKKRHIGNDFVKVFWDESGLPFNFELISGQFNFITIHVTPQSQVSAFSPALGSPDKVEEKFYNVQLLRREGLLDIGAAADFMIISASKLPAFVRNMAITSNMYAQVYHQTAAKGEYVSYWRERLRHIYRLRERALISPISSPVPVAAKTVSGPSAQRRGALLSSRSASENPTQSTSNAENLANDYDFTRFT